MLYVCVQVLLIDDDKNNCRVADKHKHRVVVFPSMPLPGTNLIAIACLPACLSVSFSHTHSSFHGNIVVVPHS